jgi:hypothetical protein
LADEAPTAARRDGGTVDWEVSGRAEGELVRELRERERERAGLPSTAFELQRLDYKATA